MEKTTHQSISEEHNEHGLDHMSIKLPPKFVLKLKSTSKTTHDEPHTPKIEVSDDIRIKPLLKWVGGKTQILDQVLSLFPQEMDNYYEIFLGGGSVLLGLLRRIQLGQIKVHGHLYVYDLNRPLIYLYKNIQTHHQEIYQEMQILKENNDQDKDKGESFYYWVRDQYNQMTPEEQLTPRGSSYLIFLNKTCFRGLFRVGPNGFNVPYGHYQNPTILDHDHLFQIHVLLTQVVPVVFSCQDFSTSLIPDQFSGQDFIYLDPPYAPETKVSFTKYTSLGFTLDQHLHLFDLIGQLQTRFLMSNAKVPLVLDHFQSPQYQIRTLICKRSINSKNPNSTTQEVLIMN